MKKLIVAPAWLGDIVMSQSLLIAIKNQQQVKIDVLAPKWFHPVLQLMPEINKLIECNIRHGQLGFFQRKKIGISLRNQDYQSAIVLPNSFKSALIPWWANIPVRTGWLGEFRYGLLTDYRALNKKKFPLMVTRFAALAYKDNPNNNIVAPTPKLNIKEEQLVATKLVFKLTSNQPMLVLCPGAAFGDAKQWPAKHHIKIINSMVKKGWQVLILGANNDYEICNKIYTSLNYEVTKKVVNLSGKTTLEQAIYLIATASLIISNDSGLMHVAAALGKQQIALFGPTTALHSPPLNKFAKYLSINTTCSPCHQKTCPLKHHDCMQKLEPQLVIDHITSIF